MSLFESLGFKCEPKLILLDLDGTLIDSVPDLSAATDAMLSRLNMPPAGIEKARLWVGNGAAMLVQRALAGCMSGEALDRVDPSTHELALSYFLEEYEECCSKQTLVYPGVFEALEYWSNRGISMACVTNKPESFTLKLLKGFSFGEYFSCVVGGDTISEKKPSPLPLLYCVEALDVDVSDCLMVGDSKTDILAARSAHVPVVCVNYGYNHGRDIVLESPDLVVSSLLEIR